MFGTKFVGATHGMMLSASAIGALSGPTGMAYLVRLSSPPKVTHISRPFPLPNMHVLYRSA